MNEQINPKRIVVVHAKQDTIAGTGRSGHLDVNPGQTLSIWVGEDESWQLSSGQSFSANGNPKRTVENPKNDQFEYSNGSLVGSLDDGKTFFPVGAWLKMGVPHEGKLTLYNWDEAPDDNKGEIEVVVGIQNYYDDETRCGRAMSAKWQSFEVKSDDHFSSGGRGLDTNVAVRPGDILRVAVSGEDVWNTTRDAGVCSANGYGFFEGKPDLVEVGGTTKFKFPRGSLIGTLDGGKTYFFVGNHLELTALSDGKLTLFCVDDTLSDQDLSLAESKRSITVYINVLDRDTYRGRLSR